MITAATSFAADFLLPNGKCYGVTTDLRRIIFDFARMDTPDHVFSFIATHAETSEILWFHLITQSYVHLTRGTVAEQRAKFLENHTLADIFPVTACPMSAYRGVAHICDLMSVHYGSKKSRLLDAVAATTQVNWGTDCIMIPMLKMRQRDRSNSAIDILLARMYADSAADEFDDICKRETGVNWNDVLAAAKTTERLAGLIAIRPHSTRRRVTLIETHLSAIAQSGRVYRLGELRTPAETFARRLRRVGNFTLADLMKWGMILQLSLYSSCNPGLVSSADLLHAYRVARTNGVTYDRITTGNLIATVVDGFWFHANRQE